MPKKLTTSEFIKRAKKVHGNKYDYSKVEYKNAKDKIVIICKEHGEFKQTPTGHLKPRDCSKCANLMTSKRQLLTIEEFIEKSRKIHGNKYDYSKVEYRGCDKKIIIIHRKCGKEFLQTPSTHLDGSGCPHCYRSVSLTTEEFVEKAEIIHNYKYDYSMVDYKTSQDKIVIICPKHGEFMQASNRHLRGQGCPKCASHLNANRRRLTREEFIKKAKEVHGDKYDYSRVEYRGSNKKIIIICPEHGEFFKSPTKHLSGEGCYYCSKCQRYNTTEEWVKKIREIRRDEHDYDYSKVEYERAHKKIAITHKKCGKEFMQLPTNHLAGQSCPYCYGNPNIITEKFIERAKIVHGNKYDYSKSEYIKGTQKVIITCPIHGDFEQIPNSHWRGNGCPLCMVGWTINSIRSFLKDMINFIPIMTQTEWYHLLRSSGILNIDSTSKGYNFTNFLSQKDKLDFDELQKFVNNEPSIYEDLINTGDTSLIEENHNIEDFINEEDNKDLINLNVKDIFRTLEKTSNLPYIDDEIAEALIGEKIWQLIQIVCEDESKIKEIKKQNSKSNLPKEVKTRFLNLYNEACKYKLPKDYNFKIDRKLVKPNLMQKLTIALLKDKKYLLNLSGTGAGKTLSALLFSRYINSNLTVIVCPNDVLDGWERTLKGVDPQANVFINNFSPKINKTKSNYVLFNVEKFQQSNSESQIRKLLKNTVDFVILDELQFMKNREGTPRSERNKNIHKLVSNARTNDNLHVLGMTATPIINELSEGVSLLELVTGQEYNEITNAVTIDNCLALRGHFVSMGIRWMPQYKQKLNIKEVYVDCTDKIIEAREIKRNPLLMENLFIEEKMNSILPKLKKGSVIYTQYKDQIVETIRKKVKELGFTCEPYTGDQNHSLRREILDGFINREIDILIATSPISTGVDGLQHVCNDLYVMSLPWTSAMFQQLIGRFWRQGQKKKQVNVTIPLSYLNVETPDGEDKEWSWCKYRYSIVKNKRSLSDVAVDGIIPEKCHISHSKALKAAHDWLQRIEEGDVRSFKRRKISVSLSEVSMKKRRKKHGDFTAINKKVCGRNSDTIHEEWQKDPSEYETYHNEYKRFRDKWSFDHINEIVIPFVNSLSEDVVIGDFGSGPLAELSNSVNKEVLSFDHVETDGVISCDLANMSKEYYDSLDASVFSLSLMGKNLTDYIREAHKCLKKDGKLFIVELSSRISSRKYLKENISKLGFKNIKIELVDRFIVISADKSCKVPNKSLKLRLGRIKP